MPWMNVSQMSDQNARALYEYIKSLGPEGDPVPQAPTTPYISLDPQMPQRTEASQDHASEGSE